MFRTKPKKASVGRWTQAFIGAAMATTLLLASGCAELPRNVERTVSNAVSPTGSTLAGLVQSRRTAAGTRFDSGFMLLAGPPAAYGSRLALVEGASRTLDLQYYTIHADHSTRRLLDAVREAAARGVRVRILIDDFHSTGRDALVLQLAFEQNIEMRMFNPLPGKRGSNIHRLLNSISDASRLQQRMHNKLFLADNVLAVAGGRNLGNAYFGAGKGGNFIDLDVLAAGPIVQDLSRSFDTYWNDQRAYPVQSLVTAQEIDEIRRSARTEREAERERELARTGATPSPADAATMPSAGDASARPSPRADAPDRVWDEKALDLRTATFVWAPAAMLADKPGKIAADDSATETPESTQGVPATAVGPAPLLASGAARPSAPSPTTAPAATKPGSGLSMAAAADSNQRKPDVPDAASTMEDRPASTSDRADTVIDGLLHLFGQARHDLLIVSPYFVPGDELKRAFSDLQQRGVRVRVLTNSLASNDAPIAHAGYARHREELLKLGVDLYEMRSEQSGIGSALGSGSGSGSGSSGSSLAGESRSMLHSKVLVMDGRLLVVGSMNLDLRSQLQNTEVALLIRSGPLSRTATEGIERTMTEGAWHVGLNDGQLIWRAPAGSGLKDTTTEPDASTSLRWVLKLFGPLAPDSML